jgi:hypothetical protein
MVEFLTGLSPKISKMRIIKKIALAFLGFILVSSIAGYFYFSAKFTPEDNSLTVEEVSEKLPIKWIGNDSNPNVALLLPVQLQGISQTFYMQLDFGAPTTMIYSNTLNSISSEFSGIMDPTRTPGIVSLQFDLGKMRVSSTQFKALNYGKEVNSNQDAVNIIGTLGTDLLEKRRIILNFKENYCQFDTAENEDGFQDFEFEKRRILLPATVGMKNLKLLYDSGTSGYELITAKDQWENYRIEGGAIKAEKANAMGNTVTVLTAPAAAQIEMGSMKLRLSEVTHIEGTSIVQNLLMRFSGMQGMVGNKLFLDQVVTIDCKNEKFKIE